MSTELLNSFETSNQVGNQPEQNQTVFNANENEASVGSVVAQHYNQLSERGLAERKESKIFHMRNLNNWIKSRIIGNIFFS